MIKDIIINGDKWYYETFYEDHESGDYEYTKFYKELKTKWKRKHIFSSKKIEVPDNEAVFTLWFDIEDCRYTKEQVKRAIDNKLELLDRCDQIKRGEIIDSENWDDIIQDIAEKHKILIDGRIEDYLVENYNVPTRKNEKI